MKMNESERETGERLVSCAFLLLFSLFGTPCIYYGDEAGVEGYRDPFNRRTFPWGRERETIVTHCQKLGKLRNEGWFDGETELLDCPNNSFCYRRGETLVITNMSVGELKYECNGSFIDLIDGTIFEDVISVAPYSGRCLAKYRG